MPEGSLTCTWSCWKRKRSRTASPGRRASRGSRTAPRQRPASRTAHTSRARAPNRRQRPTATSGLGRRLQPHWKLTWNLPGGARTPGFPSPSPLRWPPASHRPPSPCSNLGTWLLEKVGNGRLDPPQLWEGSGGTGSPDAWGPSSVGLGCRGPWFPRRALHPWGWLSTLCSSATGAGPGGPPQLCGGAGSWSSCPDQPQGARNREGGPRSAAQGRAAPGITPAPCPGPTCPRL